MVARLSAALAVCLLAPLALAQPLIEKIPSDATVYIGWAGADSLGKEYEQSHLKGVLADSDAGQFASTYLPKLLNKIGEQDREVRQFAAVFPTIAKPLWKYPTAIYFGGLEIDGDRPPRVRLAVLCNAGDDAERLTAQVNDLLKQAGEAPVPVKATRSGSLVKLTVGEMPEPAAPLSGDAAFKAAIAHAQPNAAAVIYISGERTLKLIDDLAATDREARQRWPGLKQSSGLAGLKSISWSAGFDGKQWGTRSLIAAPSPRTGVLKLLDSQPLPADALAAVPQSAVAAGAVHFDLPAAFDSLRQLVQTLDPDAGEKFDDSVEHINRMVGFDLRADLLASLGDTWAYYLDPATAGHGFLGAVFISKPKDPAKAEAALSKVEGAINNLLAAHLKDAITLRFKSKVIDGQRVHYLATPLITPTWTIKDGQWIGGLYPQSVTGAAAKLGKGKSLLDNPAYQAVRQHLGDVPASSVRFADLNSMAPVSYNTWMLLSSYLIAGEMFGVDAPPMLLPPLPKLQRHLGPAGAVSWSTDDGYFARSITPFPAAEVLAGDPIAAMLALNPFFAAGAFASIVREQRHALAADAIMQAKAYYTTDDGATWFTDDATKLSPFDKNGKPAYRVYVFKTDGGQPFPAYMERFTPDALKKMEAEQQKHNPDPGVAEELFMTGIEVKRPGAGNAWVRMNSPEGEKIRNEVASPDGKTENLEPVSPND